MRMDYENMLLELKRLAPGFYTERDGGDWYIVVPTHDDRIAEDFADRDDARRFLLWVAGGPRPEGWTITNVRPRAADLDCLQGYRATVWMRALREFFPEFVKELEH